MFPAEESCQTPSGRSGICINLNKCDALMDTVKREGLTSQSTLQQLHRATCGFEGKIPKVCCENQVYLYFKYNCLQSFVVRKFTKIQFIDDIDK